MIAVKQHDTHLIITDTCRKPRTSEMTEDVNMQTEEFLMSEKLLETPQSGQSAIDRYIDKDPIYQSTQKRSVYIYI